MTRPFVADRRDFRERSRADRAEATRCELCEHPKRYRHRGQWVTVDMESHHVHGIGQRAHAGRERPEDTWVLCCPCHDRITKRHNQLARDAGYMRGFTILNHPGYSACVEQATNEARYTIWRWRRLIWVRLIFGKQPTNKET